MCDLLGGFDLVYFGAGELHDSFHINCGGERVNVTNQYGDLLYDADLDIAGPTSSYLNGERHWGFSSTGSFLDNDLHGNTFILKNSSALLMENVELYTGARRSPLSLTYFGYCLRNGNYNVHLHFAEIQFTEVGYSKLGRRLFDIYIQVSLFWLIFLVSGHPPILLTGNVY